MPFDRDSLYGWGICRVPMPRANRDIFGDGRAGAPKLPEAERFFQPFYAIWGGLIRRDFPARRLLAVVSTALGAVVLFSLSSLLIPQILEETAPKPVEIVARLMEEPLQVPAAVPRPQLAGKKPALAPRPLPELTKREIVAVPVQSKPPAAPASRKIAVDRTREIELLAPGEMLRNFDLSSERSDALPKTASRSDAFYDASPEENPSGATAVTKNYRIEKGGGAGGVLPQGRVFVSAAAGTTVDLPSVRGIKHHFGRPRSQGDGGAPVSGRSFSPDAPSGEVSIGHTGKVGRTYQVAGGTAGGTSGMPGNSLKFGIGPWGRSNEPDVEIPVAGGSGARTPSGISQIVESAAAPKREKASFVTGIDAGSPDPSLLVSLNQLRACVDQSEEDRLRTRLATMLETEGRCRTGNMIFFFKYPQDGWTMQVSLYNPIEFADKCSALLAAIECINHSKQ